MKLEKVSLSNEDAGSEGNRPKLAIAPANLHQIFFEKTVGGGDRFTDTSSSWQEKKSDVTLPGGVFAEWELDDPAKGRATWNLKERWITTNVPIVPAHLLPDGKLENYYILFEVDEWNPVAAVGDPYLLKRINANTFIVLVEWDVTEVEKIVMRGKS